MDILKTMTKIVKMVNVIAHEFYLSKMGKKEKEMGLCTQFPCS